MKLFKLSNPALQYIRRTRICALCALDAAANISNDVDLGIQMLSQFQIYPPYQLGR